MPSENVPPPTSPETPPLAPYDPPAPAPQAAAWRRALKVVGYQPPGRVPKVIRNGLVKTTIRRDKWV
jgi:hypothetical protein